MTSEKTEISNILSGVSTDLKVDMKDVVDVFLSKYETSLHDQRDILQKEVANINKEIEQLQKKIIDETMVAIKMDNNALTPIDTGLLTITTKLVDHPLINWETTEISYALSVSVKSKTVLEGYRSKTEGTVYGIYFVKRADHVVYTSLTEQKQKLMDQLNKVNTNLKDLGRKERQIKGLIAEKKLQEIGLDGLLQEPTLLALINDPING